MIGQTTIWVVYDYGGEWEDKWETTVIAFADEEQARECARRRAKRQSGDDEWDDYCGSGVEQVQLVAEVPDDAPCGKKLLCKHYAVSWDAAEQRYWEREWQSLP